MTDAVETWTPAVHASVVDSWVRGHGKNPEDLFRAIPDTGVIVNRRVAGWVYMTNGPVAFLDQFVSDPRSDKDARRRDLRTLIGALCEIAREAGHYAIAGCPSVKSLTEAGRELGFSIVTHCDYVMRRL